MTKYTGGETVKAGFYWNRKEWGAEIIPAGGGTLPAGEVYYRIGWPVLLVAAPVMGGAFAMFLPFIGIALLIRMGVQALLGRRATARGEAHV